MTHDSFVLEKTDLVQLLKCELYIIVGLCYVDICSTITAVLSGASKLFLLQSGCQKLHRPV